jgi:hypothetical protein
MHPPDEETVAGAHQNACEEQHETALAIWDVRSPVVVGQLAEMKVGVKCSAGCQISGSEIEVRDEVGNEVARAVLGDVPWPGTSALMWTALSLSAPSVAGAHSWTVHVSEPTVDPTHHAVSAFHFVTTLPAEHTVTIKVTAKETGAPVEGVEVRIGFYKGCTNVFGVSEIDLPKGTFEINVWKNGYALLSESIDVSHDVARHLELISAPEPEDEYWMG